MILHFDRDFARTNPLVPPGFKPTTFQLTPSKLGITFITRICIISINYLVQICSQDSGGHEMRRKISQPKYV